MQDAREALVAYVFSMILMYAGIAAVVIVARILLAPGCHPPVSVARTDIRTLESAASMHLAEYSSCPTMADLVRNGDISSHTTFLDPWQHPYEITCDTYAPTVRSAGPDGRFGTADDP